MKGLETVYMPTVGLWLNNYEKHHTFIKTQALSTLIPSYLRSKVQNRACHPACASEGVREHSDPDALYCTVVAASATGDLDGPGGRVPGAQRQLAGEAAPKTSVPFSAFATVNTCLLLKRLLMDR